MELSNKTIVLGITGSIAAVRCVELVRELRRRGANVIAVMSKAATEIIQPTAMEFATNNPVITGITGRVEHVALCAKADYPEVIGADLLLIAPATANTIGKMAQGIDDTSVTTFATTAIGAGVPVVVVPAMHGAMYSNPFVKGNIDALKDAGITFVGPYMDEGKAKMAEERDIILQVERILSGGQLKGKNVLITSGATAESIDPIRILTNRASGRTGHELALEAYRRGASVTIVHNGRLEVGTVADGNENENYIHEVFVESADEMFDGVMTELEQGCDVFISAAAISDYTLKRVDTKIRSGKGELSITLKPTRKLLDAVKTTYPNLTIVGFKAETGIDNNELIRIGQVFKKRLGLNVVVANEVGSGGIGEAENEVFIIDDGVEHVSGNKYTIACAILDAVEGIIKH